MLVVSVTETFLFYLHNIEKSSLSNLLRVNVKLVVFYIKNCQADMNTLPDFLGN